MKFRIKKQIVLTGLVLFVTLLGFSQETTQSRTFSGVITATNNGISNFPNLSLGKPAVIFDLSLKSQRWSFDPHLRFSYQGKPWTFIFWGRYKAVDDKKFKMVIGAHPAFAFKEEHLQTLAGTPKTVLNTYRYLATEIAPNYYITKDFSLGLSYLYSHGVDPGTTRNSHFVKMNAVMSNMELSENTFLRWQPQAYYLKMDSRDGYYVSSILTLNKKNCPFSVSSLMNKIIQSDIPGDDFVWNVSLSYSY